VYSEPVQVQGRVGAWQRVLVPSEWYESRGGRSANDWVIDTALFLSAVLVGGIVQGYVWHSHGDLVTAVDVAAGSAACLALWARRTRPTAVLLAASAGVFSPLAQGAALIAIFNVAMRGRGRSLVAVALLALTGSVAFPLLNPAVGPVLGQRYPGFMLTAIAFGWGILVRARSEVVVSLRERSERLEAEQLRNAELAREAERRRIAREMHDVLAHRLSLLSVHAGALEFRPDAPAAEIAESAAVIRSSAAAALRELREVITVLREDTAGTEPQPTLAQLPALLEESRAAGMNLRAHLDLRGTESLPEALGRTAYRLVQEGLTNARRHAPGAPVDVTASVNGSGGLVIEVVTHSANGATAAGIHAAGAAGATAVGPSAHAGAGAPTGTGVGLIGLAERLALVGGELEHGRTAAGGFVLRGTVPGFP
jgi:signal transduction histidine kinase